MVCQKPQAILSDFAIASFWHVVRHHFNSKQRAALFSFVYGCPRIPARGFENLLGYNASVHQFTVVKNFVCGFARICPPTKLPSRHLPHSGASKWLPKRCVRAVQPPLETSSYCSLRSRTCASQYLDMRVTDSHIVCIATLHISMYRPGLSATRSCVAFGYRANFTVHCGEDGIARQGDPSSVGLIQEARTVSTRSCCRPTAPKRKWRAA